MAYIKIVMKARGMITVRQHTFSFYFYTTVGNHAPTLFIEFLLFWLRFLCKYDTSTSLI